ncbi:MAG: hypothetical protein QOG79_5665 [Mycobacterium sp.]|nr:hypothetical protein [Mycobacterium sp.]
MTAKAHPDRDGILAAAVGGFAGIGAGERWLGGDVVDHDAAATYTGDDTGNTAFEVMVKFVGSANRTYDDRCGVIPNGRRIGATGPDGSPLRPG